MPDLKLVSLRLRYSTLVHDMEPNPFIPATGAHIYGPFFVVGDAPPSFHTLAPLELETALDHLALELSQSQFSAITATLEGGVQWMENWE